MEITEFLGIVGMVLLAIESAYFASRPSEPGILGRTLFLTTFLGVSFAAYTDEAFGLFYSWLFFWLGVPLLIWAAIYHVRARWIARTRSTFVTARPIAQAPEHDPEILLAPSGACFCRAMQVTQAAPPLGSDPRYASQCLLGKCPDYY
jgi:hypothetical protein